MSATAFTHADLVRRVARQDAEPIASMAALAEELARDPSNLRKTIKALAEDGVFDWSPGAVPTLTDHGAVVLQGIDVAEGKAAASGDAAPAVWPADMIVPNPLNRALKPEKVARRADSIAEHGIVLPLVLSPVRANGVRMLIDGEYRWRGHLLTVEQGRSHPSLADGLPFVEREASEDEALAITIVANVEHENLSAWEEAQQIAKFAAAAPHLSGAEIARRLDKKAKDVTDKIRLVREATPEQIAAYEEHGSWDQFRNAVFGRAATPPPATRVAPENAHFALFLVEAALRSEHETGVWDGDLALETGLVFPLSWTRVWFSYASLSGHFRLSAVAIEWLARIGFGDDPAKIYADIAKDAGKTAPETPGHWLSEALNVRPAPTGPHVVNGVDYFNAARANEARRAAGLLPPLQANHGGSASTAESVKREAAAPELPGVETGGPAPLSVRAVLALVELAHKIGDQPRAIAVGEELPEGLADGLQPDDHAAYGAYVGKYWTDAAFNELATARLIRAVSLPGGVPPMATLTKAGVDWLAARGTDLPITATALRLSQAWPPGHPPARVGGYWTAWIESEAAPAAAPPTAIAGDQPALIEDTDHWGRDAETIAADQVRLDRVLAFNAIRDDIDEDAARALLSELGVTGPFSEDGDAGLVAEIDGATASFAFVDPDRALPPERARAIAILAAWALQVVFGEAA